jgi:regulator of replication initiation timing
MTGVWASAYRADQIERKVDAVQVEIQKLKRIVEQQRDRLQVLELENATLREELEEVKRDR